MTLKAPGGAPDASRLNSALSGTQFCRRQPAPAAALPARRVLPQKVTLPMKPSRPVLTGLMAAALAGPAAAEEAKASPPLKDTLSQAAYAIGLNLGRTLKRDGVNVDGDLVARGLKDGLAGAAPALTDDQMRAAITQLQMDVQTRMQAEAAKAAEANKAEGAAFLAANKSKPGVMTLPSGLQYQILTTGTGPTPKADDTVLCNYRGTLINGTEFDSSYKRGEPASFPVNGVIRGWTQALLSMPVGSKWRLFVPSDLAYGDKGAGADIGPGAVLIFEVELLSIQPKA